jgi:hypothetical protein
MSKKDKFKALSSDVYMNNPSMSFSCGEREIVIVRRSGGGLR